MNEAQHHEGNFHPMAFNKADSTVPESESIELSPHSFEALFHKHWTHVYRVLLRLVGDPAEAEDLALETFFRLYKRPPDSGAAREFNYGGWLHRVATNLGLHSIRSFKRRERYELAAGKGALDTAPQNQPAELLDGEEERRAARQVLAGMNPRQAELLALRYSGASYKEIAVALGTAPASIGPLLLRAEREFEKRYRVLFPEEV